MIKSYSFHPHIKHEDVGKETCVISEVSWKRLQPFLLQAFDLRTNQQLVGITITDFGIRGHFETIKGGSTVSSTLSKKISERNKLK